MATTWPGPPSKARSTSSASIPGNNKKGSGFWGFSLFQFFEEKEEILFVNHKDTLWLQVIKQYMKDKINSIMLTYINVDKKMYCLFTYKIAIFIVLVIFYKIY